jgi:hypothetical protein
MLPDWARIFSLNPFWRTDLPSLFGDTNGWPVWKHVVAWIVFIPFAAFVLFFGMLIFDALK